MKSVELSQRSCPSNRGTPTDLNPSAHDVIDNPALVSVATGPSAGDVNLYHGVGTINAILDVAGWFPVANRGKPVQGTNGAKSTRCGRATKVESVAATAS